MEDSRGMENMANDNEAEENRKSEMTRWNSIWRLTKDLNLVWKPNLSMERREASDEQEVKLSAHILEMQQKN